MTGDADDLTSYLTSDGGEPPPARHYNIMDDVQTTSNTSETETISMCVSELGSLLENDSLLLGDAEKMVMHFTAKDEEDKNYIGELFGPLFECIGVKQDIYFITEGDVTAEAECSDANNALDKLSMPSLAVVVFLREEEMRGENVWAIMGNNVDKSSWRFHHSEHVARGKLHLYENNSQDYLTARPDLPLCAMRQIHCGKKMLRFLRFVSSDNWRDNVRLYGLLLGKDPEVLKQDFCLFTSSTYKDYCIQLSLKKIPKSIKCQQTTNGILSFRVCQLGHVVPLLPNVCTPLTDDRWQTTDLDGNKIYLDVVRMRDRSCEPVPDLSDLEICDYFSDSKECPLFSDQSNEQSLTQKIHNNHETRSSRSKKTKTRKLEYRNKGGTGTHGHCDSMEELGLLIKDLAGKMEDAKNKLASDERDACGMVDGASHHSEGTVEDRMCLPYDPDASIRSLTDTDKTPKSKSMSTPDNLSISSTSSSSKAELTTLSVAKLSSAYRYRPEVVETVSFNQKKTPQIHANNQIYMSQTEESFQPAQTRQSPHSHYNSPCHPETFEMNEANEITLPPKRSLKKTSKKSTKEVNFALSTEQRVIFDDRPPLPSYSEIQRRKQEMAVHETFSRQPWCGYSPELPVGNDNDSGEHFSPNIGVMQNNLYRSKSVDELDPMPKLHHQRVDNRILDPNIRSDETFDQNLKYKSRGLKVHSRPTISQNVELSSSCSISSGPQHDSGISEIIYHNSYQSNETVVNPDSRTENTNKYFGKSMQKCDYLEPPKVREPPPYRPRPSQQLSSDEATNSVTSSGEQLTFKRFEFNGTTVPRFGRNNKHRQSVVPPPCFYESEYKNNANVFNMGISNSDFSNDYEELAVDVPGIPSTIVESPGCSDSEPPALGFYV